MSMNLVAIAGVPAHDMAGKLVGFDGMGGCGCGAPMGETAPTEEQKHGLNLMALGLVGAALVIGYFVMKEQHAR